VNHGDLTALMRGEIVRKLCFKFLQCPETIIIDWYLRWWQCENDHQSWYKW